MPNLKAPRFLSSIIIAAEFAVIARPTSRYEGEVNTYVIRIIHAVDGG